MSALLNDLLRELRVSPLIIPAGELKVKEKIADGRSGPIYRGRLRKKNVCVKVRLLCCVRFTSPLTFAVSCLLIEY